MISSPIDDSNSINLYIAYIINNNLYIKVFNDAGIQINNLILNDYIYDNSYIKLLLKDNKLLLFTNIINEDIDILLKELSPNLNINTNIIYGGTLKDKLKDVNITDNIYLSIEHDLYSGKDFNNMGKTVISKLDSEYNIEKNIYFDNDLYISTKIINNNIVILFKDQIFKYDSSLNQIIGLNLTQESIFNSYSINDYLAIFEENKLIIKDVNDNMNIIQEIYYENIDMELINVIESNHAFYLIFTDYISEYMYELILINEKTFVNELTYLDDISEYNNCINTWSKTIKLEKDLSNFNQSINGEYEIECINDEYDYKKIMKVTVLEEQNVYEGMIYPIDYKLYFTGVAFLNKEMIYNNYSLTKEGNYTLELYSNKKEKRIINFSVDNDQLYFQDYIERKSDYYVSKNQSIALKYRIKKEVKDIIINDKSYKNYTFKDDVLSIIFDNDQYGFNKYKINKIVLEDEEIILDDIITINVLDDEPSVSFFVLEDKKTININYDNESNTIRMFKLYLDDKLFKTYPLTDTEIIIPKNIDFLEAKLSIVYNNKSKELYEKELASFILDDEYKIDFGYIEIVRKEDLLYSYNININHKNSINKIKIDDKLIYEKIEEDNLVILIFILLLSLNIVGTIAYLIIKFVYKGKIKNNDII